MRAVCPGWVSLLMLDLIIKWQVFSKILMPGYRRRQWHRIEPILRALYGQ